MGKSSRIDAFKRTVKAFKADNLSVWAAALTLTYRMTHNLSRAVVTSALVLLAVVAAWGWFGLANFWGVEPGPGLMLAVLTMTMLLGFRFLRDPRTGEPGEGASDPMGWSTPE